MLCLLAATALFSGCSKVKDQTDLGEIEMYFDEQLSSLSAEGDSVHWAGSEYGDAWRVTRDGRTKYKLASDRIYFVKPFRDGYYVGVRNGGLRFYTLSHDAMTLQHTILMPEKGKLYSTYDILPVEDGLLMGTSQGLFLYREKDDNLRKLYPARQSNRNTFQVTRLLQLPDGKTVAMATENGLLYWQERNGRVTATHEGEKIGDISLYHNQLLIVAEKNCYLIDREGKENRYELPDAVHYFFRAGETLAFIGINQAFATEDLVHFTHLTLRRPVPQKASYVLSYSPGADFIWMVTDHAVWKIPYHLAVRGDDHPMMASCEDNGQLYFVDARNYIYTIDRNGNYAHKIFDFFKCNPIVSCVYAQGRFVYLDNQGKVYSVSLGRHLWSNYLTAFPQKRFASKSKVTALQMAPGDGTSQLLIGLQDGLVSMGSNGATDTMPTLRNKYVTSIFQREGDPHVYLPTLNDGLFVLQNSQVTRVMDNPNVSPRQVVVTSGFPSDMVIATNDRVFLQGSRDTLMLAGTSKLLLANDTTIYAILDNGIEKLRISGHRLYDKGHSFSDIHFNPQACQSLNGKLFLGCNLGIMTFLTDQELRHAWLPMTESKVTRNGLLASFLLIVLLVVLVVGMRKVVSWWSRRELRTRKTELTYRLHDIWPYRDIFEEEQQKRLEQLREQVSQIHYTRLTSWKRVDAQISQCSDAIMRLNRDVVLSLLRLLQTQITQIATTELFDSNALVSVSEKNLHEGSLELLGRQALVNRRWLQEVDASQKTLRQITDDLQGTLPLKGITDALPEMIDQYQKDMAIKPLKDLKPLYEDICNRYATLTTPTVTARQQQFCQQQIRQLREQKEPDKVLRTLCSQYEDVLRHLSDDHSAVSLPECLETLRRLQHLYDRSCQLIILRQVREKIAEYVRKEDLKLDTRVSVLAIHQLTEAFYAHLQKTDPRLLNDILQLNNSDSQPSRVLLLLMASPKVKRLLIPGMLDIVGNLNPVISRLVRGRLKPQEEALRAYAERHPSSVTEYILVLLKEK